MSNIRIKDLSTEATSLGTDDFIPVDGNTSGTRKISKENLGTTLEIPDVGSAANEVSLNGMLGDMAFQSSDGVSVVSAEVETLEVTDKVTGTLDVEQSSGTLTTPASVTTLRVNNSGSASNSAAVAVTSGASGSSFVLLGDNENDDIGYIKYSNQYNQLQFATAATDRVTIDSSGRVGIGTASPGSYNYGADDLVIGDATGVRGLTIASANNLSGRIFFADPDSPTSGQVRYDHSTDKLSFATGGADRWSINSSGNLVANGTAIDFGSTTTGSGTVATNGGLLADYEFGDFTVTAGGTWTSAPTSMAGKYIKVGNQVTVFVVFHGGTKAGSTIGWLEGLPFATNVWPGQGSVSDTGVTDRGVCYAANTDRLWLTGTSFGAVNYATVSYRHD